MDPNCPNCHGEGWVCESHPDQPWDSCCGDCGIPCSCNCAGAMPPGFEMHCERQPGAEEEIAFILRLRSDAQAQLAQAEVVAQLLPLDVRETAMGGRLATLRDMIRQYDEFLRGRVRHRSG